MTQASVGALEELGQGVGRTVLQRLREREGRCADSHGLRPVAPASRAACSSRTRVPGSKSNSSSGMLRDGKARDGAGVFERVLGVEDQRDRSRGDQDACLPRQCSRSGSFYIAFTSEVAPPVAFPGRASFWREALRREIASPVTKATPRTLVDDCSV